MKKKSNSVFDEDALKQQLAQLAFNDLNRDKPLLCSMVEKEVEARQKFNSSWIDQYRAKYGFQIMHGNKNDEL